MVKNQYLDDKALYKTMVEYLDKLKENPNTQIPNSIGKAILLICENLATRGNFRDYSYIDEMKDDAVEDCVRAIKNFDPINYFKPYSYFTRIAWFAFLQRIKLEKEENYVKHKSFQNMHLLDDVEIASDLSDKVIGEFEENLKKGKKKKC